MTAHPTRKPFARRGGFTLIELALVLAVVAVLVVVAAPTFGGSLRAARVRSAATASLALCERARAVAVAEGVRTACEIDDEAGEVRLLIEKDRLAAPGEMVPLDDPATRAEIDGGVFVEAARIGDEPSDEAAVLIVFEPDGSADEAFVVFVGEGGDRYAIEVRALTGRVRAREATEEDALAAARR